MKIFSGTRSIFNEGLTIFTGFSKLHSHLKIKTHLLHVTTKELPSNIRGLKVNFYFWDCMGRTCVGIQLTLWWETYFTIQTFKSIK